MCDSGVGLGGYLLLVCALCLHVSEIKTNDLIMKMVTMLCLLSRVTGSHTCTFFTLQKLLHI